MTRKQKVFDILMIVGYILVIAGLINILKGN